MGEKVKPPMAIWLAGSGAAMVVNMLGSWVIDSIHDQPTHIKEFVYSWLLVLINAYIAIFIANIALKQESGGFFLWAFLGNGIRSIAFLVLLLCLLEWEIMNVHGFVLKTFFGYFAFLAVLICGLHAHAKQLSEHPQNESSDE